MIGSVMQHLAMCALIAFSLCGTAGAQQPQQTDLVVPDDLALAIMIKTTLIAFNHAGATGNYTVLRDLGSPSFQQANTPARLAEIFQKQRGRNVDISPIVLLQPKLARNAWINKNRLLRLIGFFASSPEQVNFNLAFEAVAGKWRLFAVGVETAVPKAAAAPAENPVAQRPASQAQSAPAEPVDLFGLPEWILHGN